MLETTREYAAERLQASGEAEEIGRHQAEWLLALAAQLERNVSVTREWLDRVEAEHDNIRAALDRLEDSRATERAQRLAAALAPFWVIRGHVSEGERRLESALRVDERPTAVRADLLHGLAMLAEMRGDPGTVKVRAEEALSIYGQLETRAAEASLAMHTLGLAVAEEVDYERARELFEESVRASRELGEEHYAMVAADSLAWTCNQLGDRERARALDEDNLLRARAMSNRRGVRQGGQGGDGRSAPLPLARSIRGDRRRRRLLGREAERHDAGRHPHAARRGRLRRGLGGGPAPDRR
jgi:tetratricopeptide (TPR) repeat protein